MAIITIINEDGRPFDAFVNSTVPEIQNFQQKFIFANIVVKEKTKMVQSQNILIRGKSLTNSITPPLLVNSSTSMLTSHVYNDVAYMHSSFAVPTTYTTPDKDFQGKQTITIKPRGSYVSDNTTGGTAGGSTTPYWS